MIDKRPGVIARPRTAADVVACVNVARTHGLPIAIRGGGHNVAGRSVCDDGIVIDFADMKAIRVDPARRSHVRNRGAMDGVRSRDPSRRPGDDRRHDWRYGHCGAHARRRVWLARRQVRDDGRQPAGRRCRARRREPGSREQHRAPGSVPGASRRRRQLRRRHLVRTACTKSAR